MLPSLIYNMDGGSNSLNNNAPPGFGGYDDGVILNCVRNRKKNSEMRNCPVCSCTIRQGELESHLALEVERLTKLSSGGSKRKISSGSPGLSNMAMPGSSTDVPEESDVDVRGGTGSEVYQRVHSNRLGRLRSRARRCSPAPPTGECPVCGAVLPSSRLQRHALRCLRRTGASIDDDVPDTSSEEGSIDVENDEPRASAGFGAEYQWCGEWRVRATALQDQDTISATPVRRVSNDTALVVDGDEDTELYGPPQYSPSRIDPQESNTPNNDTEVSNAQDGNVSMEIASEQRNLDHDNTRKSNGLVEASAETRIQALKARIKELESRQNCGTEAKCLICLGPYTSPAVSIQCWHIYCEICWIDSLRSKKICPQCNAITTTQHLRRIYM